MDNGMKHTSGEGPRFGHIMFGNSRRHLRNEAYPRGFTPTTLFGADGGSGWWHWRGP